MHHQQNSTSSLTNPKIFRVTIPKPIRLQFHINITSRVTTICNSTGLRDNCQKIIWWPHPRCSGWWLSLQVHKQCRRPKGRSPLPLSWFQSHDGPKMGVPQGIHQLLPQIWLSVHSQTECEVHKINFTVPLPGFKQHWNTLIGYDILFLGYSKVISFLKSATSCQNTLSLNYVSSKHLLSPCPPSLFKAFDHSNSDRQVCIDSYHKGK